MIRINLLAVKQLRAEVSRRRDLILGGIVLGVTALLLLGVYAYQSYRLSTLNAELVELRGEVEALNVKVKQVGDLQNKIKEFTSKNKIIEDLEKKKVGPVRVMESLSAAAPPRLWLTEYKDSGGKLVMTGQAIDDQTVADFLKALAASSYFRDVELLELEVTQGGAGSARYKKFYIRATISYQPRPSSSGNKAAGDPPVKPEKKG
jgi:type IV pilus assembly protein PilN